MCPPSRDRAGGLRHGRPGGNGPGKASGRQTAAGGVRLAAPQAVRGPVSPAPAVPPRLALGWLGLTGRRKGPRTPARRGRPETRGKTGTGPLLPSRCLCQLCPPPPGPSAGLGTLAIPPVLVARPGPCWAGGPWPPRCLPEPCSLLAGPIGRVTRFIAVGITPCGCCQGWLPLQPFPTGLPARLGRSQARGMEGRCREHRWQQQGHATAQTPPSRAARGDRGAAPR